MWSVVQEVTHDVGAFKVVGGGGRSKILDYNITNNVSNDKFILFTPYRLL